MKQGDDVLIKAKFHSHSGEHPPQDVVDLAGLRMYVDHSQVCLASHPAPFFEEHWISGKGRVVGGVTSGLGFTISWQNGPLDRGADRREPNGAVVEDILLAARGRLSAYQRSSCDEHNSKAIRFIDQALQELRERTAEREARGAEGTYLS